jgi:Cd2+/Zn2+-exporting ATPase
LLGIACRQLRLANHRWIRELGFDDAALEQVMTVPERLGPSVSLLAEEKGVLALIAVADRLPRAALTLQKPRRLGRTPVMLSGDSARIAQVIAERLGIEQVCSELLPEQELAAIAEPLNQAPTGMLGDGINDATALAGAQIGFAMGVADNDIAIEAANVVILDDDPQRLVDMIRLSRRTMRVLWQHIALALGIKGSFLVLPLLGRATLWPAVLADTGTSLLVIANEMRLLRQRWT